MITTQYLNKAIFNDVIGGYRQRSNSSSSEFTSESSGNESGNLVAFNIEFNSTALESANVPLMLSTELLVRPIQTQYNPIADRLTQPIYPPPQAPEQNIVKTCMNCIDIVGNNGLEWTVCKVAYHYRCSIPPITNYYQTLNCWKCSRCWSCNFAQHYWSWSNLIAIFFLYLTNIRDA